MAFFSAATITIVNVRPFCLVAVMVIGMGSVNMIVSPSCMLYVWFHLGWHTEMLYFSVIWIGNSFFQHKWSMVNKEVILLGN